MQIKKTKISFQTTETVLYLHTHTNTHIPKLRNKYFLCKIANLEKIEPHFTIDRNVDLFSLCRGQNRYLSMKQRNRTTI